MNSAYPNKVTISSVPRFTFPVRLPMVLLLDASIRSVDPFALREITMGVQVELLFGHSIVWRHGIGDFNHRDTAVGFLPPRHDPLELRRRDEFPRIVMAKIVRDQNALYLAVVLEERIRIRPRLPDACYIESRRHFGRRGDGWHHADQNTHS